MVKKKTFFISLIFFSQNIFSLLWAGSSSTLTTDVDFLRDTTREELQRQGLQIEGVGQEATLKLLNAWTNLNPADSPTARKHSPLTYDTSNKKIILFGGSTSNNVYLYDTWIFDPRDNRWQEGDYGVSPSSRAGHNLVYLTNGKTILFGGKDKDNFFNDTWIYDGSKHQWEQSIIVGPNARAGASACAISKNSLILFGGYDNQGQRLNDLWRYDLDKDSWTKLNPLNSPLGRDSAGMSYHSGQNKIVLFGGHDGLQNLNDTWVYDPNTNNWVDKSSSSILSPPPSRSGSPLVYDSLNNFFVLFGGLGASTYDDTWFYDLDRYEWRPVTVSTLPSTRYGHGLVYASDENKVYLFGGVSGGVTETYYQDTWSYFFRSSGVYTSPSTWFDTYFFPTSLKWESFNIAPEPLLEGRELKFEIFTSTDNFNWLTISTYPYSTPPTPGVRMTISPIHSNQRYFKFKVYFKTNKPPDSPELKSFTVYYNRAPSKPYPYYPQNITLNDQTPLFTWDNATDRDNDNLTYQLQVDTSSVFSSPDVNLFGIAQSSTEISTLLPEGKWYWRVGANDGTINGDWSNVYSFLIDTTPPREVTDLNATIGEGNGEILLSWADPFDGGTTNYYQGSYVVKWTTKEITSETQWGNIISSRTWTGITIFPESKQTKPVSGLENATTYYFCLRVTDEAGNLNPLSNCVSAFTNAKPAIDLVSPNQGEYGTSTILSTSAINISWTYSDPNAGDPNAKEKHSFAIYLSTDNGTNYTILIISDLPDKTTFYLWDSRQAANGSSNRIKVIATDKRGLNGEDSSDSNFTISNLNERPEISIIYPQNNEIISGTTYFRWLHTDPNLMDQHNFRISYSTDNGVHWSEIARVPEQNYYLFHSTNYPNWINYRLKIKIEDNATPLKDNEDTSNFGIANYNVKPTTFSLISPLPGRLYSFPLVFWWEKSIDPNGDEVTYTLCYSTDSQFGVYGEIKNLKDNFCRLPFFPEEEKVFYWKVKAEDPFGAFRWSNETKYFVTVSRKKVEIRDLLVEISTGLPDNAYLRVDEIFPEEYLPLSWANQRSLTDPLTRKIYDFAYRVGIYDTSDKLISPSGIKLNILYRYRDINGYFEDTNIPVGNLRICRLEENVSSAFWTTAVYPQEVDRRKKNVSASLDYEDSFSGIIISLLGYAPAVGYLSQVANYPNPFNPTKGERKTRIEYYLTEDSNVTIRIYNLVGDLVWTKENAAGKGAPEGPSNIEFWDGKNDAGMTVANGVYLCVISARPTQGGEERKISRLIGVVK